MLAMQDPGQDPLRAAPALPAAPGHHNVASLATLIFVDNKHTLFWLIQNSTRELVLRVILICLFTVYIDEGSYPDVYSKAELHPQSSRMPIYIAE